MQACHASSTSLRPLRKRGTRGLGGLQARVPMVAGLQRIVDLLRAASGASSVTGQPSTVYVCHCMHVLGAEAAEDSKWGPLLPEEINGHANPNPNPNPYPNPNPNPNPVP